MEKNKPTTLSPIYMIWDRQEAKIVDYKTPYANISNPVFTSRKKIEDEVSILLSNPANFGKVYYILESVAIVERQILPVKIIKFDE